MENFDLNLVTVTINKKCIKNTNTVGYEIKHITIWENTYEKAPRCLRFSDLDAYFIEENENKYLVFALTENDKKMLELYSRL